MVNQTQHSYNTTTSLSTKIGSLYKDYKYKNNVYIKGFTFHITSLEG